jgi:hypothetical protein
LQPTAAADLIPVNLPTAQPITTSASALTFPAALETPPVGHRERLSLWRCPAWSPCSHERQSRHPVTGIDLLTPSGSMRAGDRSSGSSRRLQLRQRPHCRRFATSSACSCRRQRKRLPLAAAGSPKAPFDASHGSALVRRSTNSIRGTPPRASRPRAEAAVARRRLRECATEWLAAPTARPSHSSATASFAKLAAASHDLHWTAIHRLPVRAPPHLQLRLSCIRNSQHTLHIRHSERFCHVHSRARAAGPTDPGNRCAIGFRDPVAIVPTFRAFVLTF